MKKLTVVLLSVLLAIPAWASDSIEKKAQKIPIGYPVEVKLKNHQPIHGEMGEVFPGGFVVKIYADRKFESRRIEFADVVSIKQPNRHSDLQGLLYVTFVVSVAAAAVAGIHAAAH